LASTRNSGTSRSAAERSQVTHEWLRACEELHRALLTPMGLPPRPWAAKVALARQVDILHGHMIVAWGLLEKSPSTAPERET